MAEQPAERKPDPLRPVHPSFHMQGGRYWPRDMERVKNVPRETIEAMERIALDIFTDMANGGWSFQQCLSAIYTSGLQHGQELGRKIDERD